MPEKLPRNKVFLNSKWIHLSAVAGDKINRTLQNDTNLFQMLILQTAASARLNNPAGAFDTDSGHAQKLFIGSAVDLHRELFQMPQRPVCLRV